MHLNYLSEQRKATEQKRLAQEREREEKERCEAKLAREQESVMVAQAQEQERKRQQRARSLEWRPRCTGMAGESTPSLCGSHKYSPVYFTP